MSIQVGKSVVYVGVAAKQASTVQMHSWSLASPIDVSTLRAWYDLADPTSLYTDTSRTTRVSADGNAIASVADKSGQANHLTQSVAGQRPLYKVNIVNTKAAALFDGSNDCWATAAFGAELTQPNTIFVVAKAAAVGDALAHWMITGLAGASGRNDIFLQGDPSSVYTLYAGASLAAAAASNTNWHTYSGIFNGASSKGRLDGGAVLTGLDGDAGSQTLAGITIGAEFDQASDPWSGYIAEVIVYNASLSAANHDIVGRYLAAKYGLTWTAVS